MNSQKPEASSSRHAAPKPKVNCIIDSGAFSAWKLNKQIDLKKYCDYIEANHDWITTYINLDRIDPKDPEGAARDSFANLKYMRERGLNPMPVYHVGEDISWLLRMLDLGCDYIGLAALSMRASDRADNFYDYVWSHLVNRDGLPIVKIHGLGEGRTKQLKRYPWYSADSTSWIYTAQRTGQITLPSGASVSMRNDGGGSKSSPDLGSMGDDEREGFEQALKESGVSSKAFDVGGKDSWLLRAYVSAWYYAYLQKEIRAIQPIKFHPRGFLNQEHTKIISIDEPFNLHLVCSEANVSAFPIIAKLRYPSILLSYYYLSLPPGSHGDIKRGTRRLDQVKSFISDPIQFASSTQPWQECWNLLGEYIK